jgi:hypothetical protein
LEEVELELLLELVELAVLAELEFVADAVLDAVLATVAVGLPFDPVRVVHPLA